MSTEPVKCHICEKDTSQHYYLCDRAGGDEAWCPTCFDETQCGKGEHGEGCGTAVFDDAGSEPHCRLCGCTEHNACVDDERGACSWTAPAALAGLQEGAPVSGLPDAPSAPLCSHCADSLDLFRQLVRGEGDRVLPAEPDDEFDRIELLQHHAEQLLKILTWCDRPTFDHQIDEAAWAAGFAADPSVFVPMEWVPFDVAVDTDRLDLNEFLARWKPHNPGDPDRCGLACYGEEGDLLALGDDAAVDQPMRPSWGVVRDPDEVLVPIRQSVAAAEPLTGAVLKPAY